MLNFTISLLNIGFLILHVSQQMRESKQIFNGVAIISVVEMLGIVKWIDSDKNKTKTFKGYT